MRKPNGKIRPLGIPTIVDRIVQQCILRILEPIYEARFHDSSYGLRLSRSTEHAIAECARLMQIQHLHYVVDIDIQGFFDDVYHTKLVRQLWNLGIRDKKLLCVIKEMSKADIVMPDKKVITPTKETPRGGILSPLPSNVVLSELDWWVSSQWLTMPTHYPYKQRTNNQRTEIKNHTYRALRTDNLKEIYVVRYADGFKISRHNYYNTKRTYQAVAKRLQDRLKLNVSEEKSRTTNLKQRYSEFLGFKLEVKPKGKKFVIQSHIGNKVLKNARENISRYVTDIKRPTNEKEQYKTMAKYNAAVSGLHNCYQIAANVSLGFAEIAFRIKKQMNNRLSIETSETLNKGFIKEECGESKQLRFLNGHPLIPVGYIRAKDTKHRKKVVNKYTVKGRAFTHKNLQIDIGTFVQLMRHPVFDESIEFADNRISLFTA